MSCRLRFINVLLFVTGFIFLSAFGDVTVIDKTGLTIGDIIQTDAAFSSCYGAIKIQQPGLIPILTNASQTFMFLAPRNPSTIPSDMPWNYSIVPTTVSFDNLQSGQLLNSSLRLSSLGEAVQKIVVYRDSSSIWLNEVPVSTWIKTKNGIVVGLDGLMSLPASTLDKLSTATSLSTLYSLIRTHKLEGLLSVPVTTLFAPNEAAFRRLPTPLLRFLQSNGTRATTIFQSILSTHIFHGRPIMYREELLSQDQTFLKMSNFETAWVDVKRATTNYDAVVRVNATSVVTAFNNVTKEGVIHTIDGVLFPRTLNVTPCYLMEGLGRYAFLQAIRAAGLLNKFCNPNANASVNYTFFVPPDSALLPPPSSSAKRNFDEELEEQHELNSRKGSSGGGGRGGGGYRGGGGGSRGGSKSGSWRGSGNLKKGGYYNNRNGPYYYPGWYFFYFPVYHHHYNEQQPDAEKALTEEQRTQLASFVNSHIVQGIVAPRNFTDGMILNTLSGLQLIVKKLNESGGVGWAVSIYNTEAPTQPITKIVSSAASIMEGLWEKDVVYEVSDTLISQSNYVFDQEDEGLGAWGIVGICLGVLAFIAILCTVTFLAYRHIFKSKRREYTFLE